MNILVYDSNMPTPTDNRKYRGISEPRQFWISLKIAGDNLYLGSTWVAYDNAGYNYFADEECYHEIEDNCTYVIDSNDWDLFPTVIRNKYPQFFNIQILKDKYPDWSLLELQ